MRVDLPPDMKVVGVLPGVMTCKSFPGLRLWTWSSSGGLLKSPVHKKGQLTLLMTVLMSWSVDMLRASSPGGSYIVPMSTLVELPRDFAILTTIAVHILVVDATSL